MRGKIRNSAMTYIYVSRWLAKFFIDVVYIHLTVLKGLILVLKFELPKTIILATVSVLNLHFTVSRMPSKTGALFNAVSPCINMHASNVSFFLIVLDLPGVVLCLGLTFRL